MAAPVATRVTNTLILAAHLNAIHEYIEDGTYRVNTLSLSIGGTSVISSARAISNVISAAITTPDTTNSVSLTVTQNDTTNNPNAITVVNTGSGYSIQVSSGTIILPNGGAIDEFSTDGTLAGNSDLAVPTEKAVKTYVDTQILTTDTLQEVFDNGQSITIANTDNQTLAITQNDTTNNPVAVNLTSTSTARALVITSSVTIDKAQHIVADSVTTGSGLFMGTASASFTGTAGGFLHIDITNGSATGTAAKINMDGNGIALDIDSEATAAKGVNIDLAGAGQALYVASAGDTAAFTGVLEIYSNAAVTQSSAALIRFRQDNASSNAKGIYAIQDGNQQCFYVEHNGNGTGVAISASATTANILDITGSSLTSGKLAYFYSNSADATARNLVEIVNDNTAADNAACLKIQQDGDEYSINIVHTGGGKAVLIDSESTGDEIMHLNGKYGLGITQDLSGGRALQVSRDIAEAGSAYMAQFINDNAADTAGAVSIKNDGTGNGLFIDQNANGLALNIDKDCTVNDTRTWAVQIASDNAGTGTALGCGIDMSSFSVDEPVFKFVADAITGTGTVSQQIAIDIGGTTYYLVAYTHGS